MLLSKDAIADVVEVVRGSDFYRPAHEQVYDAILDLYGRGEPADAITVADELGKRGEIARMGGAPYLHTLLASVPVAANAGYYADIVRDKAILRRLADASVRIGQMSYAATGEVDQIVDHAQAEIYNVTERHAAEDYKPLAELMQPTLDEMEAISSRGGGLSGVPTGFIDVDELTNGLHAGQMVVLAGRPGSGKSTLALDIARAASIANGLTSVIFSLELSQVEITMRLLSAEASVPLNHIRNGKMSDDDWTRVANKMGQVSEAPMFIDDSPNLAMMEIRAKARRLKQRHDLRLIIIDYIQLMTSGKKVESRQLEVSEFSRQIKLLAKELEVPVVALSQLNRGPEQRTDKKPMLSDLRESGSLEQDSDLVVLVHRPDMYDKESERPARPTWRSPNTATVRPGPSRSPPGALQPVRRHGGGPSMSMSLRGRATGLSGVPQHWRGPLPDVSVRRRLPQLDGYAQVPMELLFGGHADLAVLTWSLLRLSFDDRSDVASYQEFADALGFGHLSPKAVQKRFSAALGSLLDVSPLGRWIQRERTTDNQHLYRAVVPAGAGKRYAMLRRSDIALLALPPKRQAARPVTVSNLANFARWQLECGQRGWTADPLSMIAARWKVGEATLWRSRSQLETVGLLEVTERPGGRYPDLVWLKELYDPHWQVPSDAVEDTQLTQPRQHEKASEESFKSGGGSSLSPTGGPIRGT